MNYILRQIADICENSPDCTDIGSLRDFDDRMEEYDKGMGDILKLAHELQAILDGKPHAHVAGTLSDLDIDICAVCGADIRATVHQAQP